MDLTSNQNYQKKYRRKYQKYKKKYAEAIGSASRSEQIDYPNNLSECKNMLYHLERENELLKKKLYGIMQNLYFNRPEYVKGQRV